MSKWSLRTLAAAWAVVLCSEARAGGQPPGNLDAEIEEHIRKLADDSFATREVAQKALLQIGKPAVPPLYRVYRARADPEVRLRAARIIRTIDPAFFRRLQLAEQRKRVAAEIARVKGGDTATWGEDITNPFTNLSEEVKENLDLAGVDVPRLAKLRAVLLRGEYQHGSEAAFVNRDPDTVLVIAAGFTTEGHVYSAGPILAVEKAHVAAMTGADLVWFPGKPTGCFGRAEAPLIIVAPSSCECPYVPRGAGVWYGDYGWRRPDDFLKPAGTAEAIVTCH